MAFNLRSRDLLKISDFTREELNYLIDLGIHLKKQHHTGVATERLKGKSICVMFQKTSTRTRCSFETAAFELGMGCTYLDSSSSQFGKKESVADTARVLSRYYDGIEFRGFKQADVEELAKYASVPVWNGLTDESHPTQMIADMMTIKEWFGHLGGIKLVFLGDGRFNMGNSLMVTCAKLGLDYVLCGPKKYWPKKDLIEQCRKWCKKSGGSVTFTEDKMEAVEGANVIYTDIWVSMGESFELWDERIKLMKPYQVDMETMLHAEKTNKIPPIFMHCLPSYHGLDTEVGRLVAKEFGKKYPLVRSGELEVTDEVFNSKYSFVFEEAENRLHSIKAIILATIGI
ncbi:MAG: ornithine carbamoyltransferase [Mycoplasmoidaceae bacterium]